MLYKKTEAAICDFLSSSEKRHGYIQIIFNVDNLAVAARFMTEADLYEDPHLHPSEFSISCELQEAEETGVAIRAAAFNAVTMLSRIVNIAEETKDRPALYGTMTLPHGEVVPYDETVMSFLHEDCYINDPTLSECGRFTVDPLEAYGFTQAVDENGEPCLSRPLDAGELRLTGADGKGLPEQGSQSNTLIRLDADGGIMASARISQIPTGDDYPEDIQALTKEAKHQPCAPAPPQHNYVAHGLSESDSRENIQRAINLVVNEGLQAAVDLEDAHGGPVEGPAAIAIRLDIGAPIALDIDRSSGLGKLIIPLRPTAACDEGELAEALEWVMQQGEQRVREMPSTSREAELIKRIQLSARLPEEDEPGPTGPDL